VRCSLSLALLLHYAAQFAGGSKRPCFFVVSAVAPKPVNLLVGAASELTMRDIAALGVRRVSVGGALARSAWGGFMRAATLIAEEGRFDAFAEAAAGCDLDALYRGL